MNNPFPKIIFFPSDDSTAELVEVISESKRTKTGSVKQNPKGRYLYTTAKYFSGSTIDFTIEHVQD